MFTATNIEGDTWFVTQIDEEKTDEEGNPLVLSKHKVAVRAGGDAEDAIAALQDAKAPLSKEDRAAHTERNRIAEIKAAAQRRIIAVLDLYTVANIQGAFVAGELDDAQEATFKTGRLWVAAMQDTSRDMILDPLLPDHTQDAAWPDVPSGLPDLAKQF